MSNLINMADVAGAPKIRDFKEIRRDFGLSRAEAAVALGVSRASIENWERKPCTKHDDAMITAKFQKFVLEHPADESGKRVAGRNLLFGRYPLRMAREVLELTTEAIAAKYGYSASAWKKFEGNGRPLNSAVMSQLEADVRDAFLSSCAVSS